MVGGPFAPLAAQTQRRHPFQTSLIALGTVNEGVLTVEETRFQEWRAKYALPKPKLRGAGDVIASVAKPIARVLDRKLGTNLENCKPCAQRQAKLNAALPF